MKRNILLCSLLVISFVGCFAQSRIGGDFGFGIYAKTINGSSNKDININLSIEPRYTYMLNDKWEVGGSLSIGTSQSIITKNRASNFVWAVNPLARFLLVGNERIGFWLETKGTLGTSSMRVHDKMGNITGNGIDLQWGLNANPVLTYQITEHFRLDATFAFLGIGLNGSTYFNNGAKSSIINFGAHLSNGSFTTVVDHVETIVDYAFTSDIPYAQGLFTAKMVDFQIGFSYSF